MTDVTHNNQSSLDGDFYRKEQDNVVEYYSHLAHGEYLAAKRRYPLFVSAILGAGEIATPSHFSKESQFAGYVTQEVSVIDRATLDGSKRSFSLLNTQLVLKDQSIPFVFSQGGLYEGFSQGQERERELSRILRKDWVLRDIQNMGISVYSVSVPKFVSAGEDGDSEFWFITDTVVRMFAYIQDVPIAIQINLGPSSHLVVGMRNQYMSDSYPLDDRVDEEFQDELTTIESEPATVISGDTRNVTGKDNVVTITISSFQPKQARVPKRRQYPSAEGDPKKPYPFKTITVNEPVAFTVDEKYKVFPVLIDALPVIVKVVATAIDSCRDLRIGSWPTVELPGKQQFTYDEMIAMTEWYLNTPKRSDYEFPHELDWINRLKRTAKQK